MEITRGRISGAKKIVIYGPEGIGKTTFASKFPDPVFIDTEGSTKELDVNRLPAPSSWQMIKEEVRYVIDHPDCCRTLVLDTADWAEDMCCKHVCGENQVKGLEAFGYGKGYKYACEEFGSLINLLTDVTEKGVNVVVTAHAAMRKFEQPDEMGAYDRWEMKLINTQKCSDSAMLKEWADAVLFANYKTHTVSVDKEGKKKKAMGAGQRVMYTTHHSCWDAKNRYGMPDELPFDFNEIAQIFDTVPDPEPVKPARAAKGKKKDPAPASNAPEESAVMSKSKEEAAPEQNVPAESEPVDRKNPPADDPLNIPDMMHKEVNPDPRIPKALRDLMIAGNINEQDIMNVVGEKGYFPADMPVTEYPDDFITEWLIPCWDKVKNAVIKSYEEIPFE